MGVDNSMKKQDSDLGTQFVAPLSSIDTSTVRNKLRPYIGVAVLCLLITLFTACDTNSNTSSTGTNTKHTLSTNNGSITYSISPHDVLIRTFYGGGKLGTLEISPEISIYGDGSYILGPGLQMQQGQLDGASLEQLLHSLVDTDGLLKLNRQQFYDIPDQNATLLQLMLNGKSYEFLYGAFGNLQESAQDMDEYRRLGKALTSIREALNGPTHSYASQDMALLVHQDFSPDLSQNIPDWRNQDFHLVDAATYECGPIPPDETGPNAGTGCLTYTIPHSVLLLNARQLQVIKSLLQGQQQGVFFEQGRYYSVVLRPLLPDELTQKKLAMFGSGELSYAGVPLKEGPIPTPTPKP